MEYAQQKFAALTLVMIFAQELPVSCDQSRRSVIVQVGIAH